jgi:DNA adenine methylase
MGAFRYPGAKTKLAQTIRARFPDTFAGTPMAAAMEYREPFFGAGGVGLSILPYLPDGTQVWLNDADLGVANYWFSVLHHHQALIAQVQQCSTPTVELYTTYLAQAHQDDLDPVTSGFLTLFLHQCSYSGLGKKAGSPIGGWGDQTAKGYKIDCRWHPQRLVQDIVDVHATLRRLNTRITCGDFAPVLTEMSDPSNTVVYCDPPYVKRGAQLYAKSMEEDDHHRLATLLHQTNSHWILSYDEDHLVRQLYHDCLIEAIKVGYTVTNGARERTSELLITPQAKRRDPWKNGYMIGMTHGINFTELSQRSGLREDVIRNRMRRGKTVEQALSIPARPYKKKEH